MSYYYPNNGWFEQNGKNLLWEILDRFNTQIIIEVGSGFSTAAMWDYSLEKRDILIETIDIDQTRLNKFKIPGIARFTMPVQDYGMNNFRKLNENDLLFIDSSHIYKKGSDVEFLIEGILPSLNNGVIIHFHDVFENFEYPKSWMGRSYNEAQYVKKLIDNKKYKIIEHKYGSIYIGRN